MFTAGSRKVIAAIATGLLLIPAATASASRVSSVTFSGTEGQPGPTVTVTGTGFPAKAPKGSSAATDSCGDYGPGNGDWFGKITSKKSLVFIDDTNEWWAGEGTPNGGNCIGIVLESWSPTQVVFKFGVAYGSFASEFGPWMANAGDHFVLKIANYWYGGTVGY
jgi:hypothetical protein